MTKEITIVTLLGTRPELIKMSAVIKRLDDCCNHILVHTGQNYDHELNQIFFDDLDIRPADYYLDAVGSSMAKTIGNIFVGVEKLFSEIKPDALVVYGDTNSCLSVYVAKRMQIPIFHLEAGNRCFDYRVPEEINRKIVDHLADVNMVLSQEAKENLIAEGLPRNRIFNVGSNMPEVIENLKFKIDESTIIEDLEIKNKFILVSIHREENLDDLMTLQNIVKSINKFVKENKIGCIWTCHPRLQKILPKLDEKIDEEYIQLCAPFGLSDYIALQKSACCLISDSGTVSEEASILKIPCVTIRNAHERMEGMQKGAFIMSERGENLDAMIEFAMQPDAVNSIGEVYPIKNTSYNVVKIILSNIESIKREVYKNRESIR